MPVARHMRGARAGALLAALALLALGLVGVGSARADARLDWEYPALSGCLSAHAITSEVEALLGQRVFNERDDARIHVRGVVSSDADGRARLLLTVRDADRLLGERTLLASDGRCASLHRPMVLVLTMLLEGALLDGDASGRVAAGGSRVFGGGLGVSLGTAELPRPGAGLDGALVLGLTERLRARADASYWLPVTVQTGGGQGARLSAASLALRACGRAWGTPTRGLWLCGGARFGAFLAAPRGLPEHAERVRLLSEALAELQFEHRLGGRVGVCIAAGPSVSLARPAFLFTSADGQQVTLHRPDTFGASLRAGLIIWSR